MAKTPLPAKRILVVDDELDITDELKAYFQQQGFETLTAATGEEALALISSHKPALVMLDMKLGSGISGMEVLRRTIAAKTGTHIIMVTAVDDQNVVEMAKGLGVCEYINKPFTFEKLERIVLAKLKSP